MDIGEKQLIERREATINKAKEVLYFEGRVCTFDATCERQSKNSQNE